jgi:hypothetical protein
MRFSKVFLIWSLYLFISSIICHLIYSMYLLATDWNQFTNNDLRYFSLLMDSSLLIPLMILIPTGIILAIFYSIYRRKKITYSFFAVLQQSSMLGFLYSVTFLVFESDFAFSLITLITHIITGLYLWRTSYASIIVR